MREILIHKNLRRCQGCKKVFPLSAKIFDRNINKSGGLAYLCKKCKSARRRYRQKNDPAHRKRSAKLAREWNKTFKAKHLKYKSNARDRGYEWNLTKKDFTSFWQKPCYYCGDKIETIGLDRINNEKGYLMDNVVSCCETCNRMKLGMTLECFINQCKKVVQKEKIT